VEAGGSDATEFDLDNRGPTNLVVLAILAAMGAAAFAYLAGKAAIAFVVDDPGPGEGGRAAALGFFCAFAALSYLAAEYGWRGRTGLIAYRSPGSVSIEGDILRIDAPGIVSRPVELHRAWVEGAELLPYREMSATTFCPGLMGTTCVVRLSRPIGIPHARRQLGLPRDPTPLPDPSKAVEAIALDIKDRQEATGFIDRWAKNTSATAPSEPPLPTPADRTQRNRRLLAWAVLVVGLASTYFTLPS
jgi:hypothetical protein